MSEDLWLWAVGACGALMFAGAGLGMKLYADPGGDAEADRRRRALALWNFALAVITGAVSAQVFADVAQQWAAHLVKLPRAAAALIIGVSANFLWPKVLRRLGEAVDTAPPPHGDAP